MAKRRVMLTFPDEAVKEPIIYNIGQQFKVVINIRQAELSESQGWIVLDLEGEEKAIEDGIAWVIGRGVRVDPIVGDKGE